MPITRRRTRPATRTTRLPATRPWSPRAPRSSSSARPKRSRRQWKSSVATSLPRWSRNARPQSRASSGRGPCGRSPRPRRSIVRSGSSPPRRLRAVPWDVLNDEQRELRDLVRQLARERIAPRAAEIDSFHEFPWDVVELFRENDIFGLSFAEEYGGLGTGTLLSLIAIEEVGKVCATSALILAVQELGSLGLKLAGSDEQKERYLPKFASGEWLPAYALTESGSGSDSAAMRTTARRDGDEYVIDGSKRFITNAGVANLYTVFAKTDPDAGHDGISAFVVESDAPGFAVARLEAKMGISGSTTGELTFDDCRIPAANLLGEEGEGFRIAMRILDRSRPRMRIASLKPS